ncbi:MAG: AI-2E family transporter [Nitrospirota bacterium]
MEKFSARLARALPVLIVISVILFFLVSVIGVIKLIIIAALLAYIIDPLATLLESRGMGRTHATAIIFFSILLAAGISLIFLLPMLASEISAIQTGFSSEKSKEMILKIEFLIKEEFSFFGVGNFDLTEGIHKTMVYLGDWLFSHIIDVAALITNLVIIPFMVFFLLKDGRAIKKEFLRVLPNRYFEMISSLLYKMDLQLGSYLRGQFIDAVVIGILSTLALWLLGLKYFIVIGAFTGLANLIPYLGPVAGGTLSVIASVMQRGDLSLVAPILLSFITIRMIDDVIVQPLVVARSVKMHPMLVLLAVIIGGKFFGILGMLISVPVTGFLKVVLEEGITSLRRYRLS